MLLFNNYPLGGGAIHVAYSTSATAKARQQALRQVRVVVLTQHVACPDSWALLCEYCVKTGFVALTG